MAAESQELFSGVVFSSAGLEVDPDAAGPVLVSTDEPIGLLSSLIQCPSTADIFGQDCWVSVASVWH